FLNFFLKILALILIMENDVLTKAYEYCKNISKKYAKTFYFASFFLPKEKRYACYAIYAFCRYADELVDRKVALDTNIKEKETNIRTDRIISLLNDLKNQLQDAYNNKINIENNIMIALSNVFKKYNIPIEQAFELISGVEMDTFKSRYENFEELKIYCKKVASSVGLMVLNIFGYSNEKAIEYAIDMGIALQLTNILRDIKEDALRNRIYLPLEDLERFNYSEKDLLENIYNENFINLMKYQIDRANEYYNNGNKGLKYIDRKCLLGVLLMTHNYRMIHREIERLGYNVFSHRAYLPFHKKVLNLFIIYLKYLFKHFNY
ncbi:MAG: phytoene/squalene synthase family protein, partial [Ignavibacteria bacterium]|nr:phytoene/squalene synthase family protein [Ignavibacteria bacterium]